MLKKSTYRGGQVLLNRSACRCAALMAFFLFSSVGCALLSDPLDDVIQIEDEAARLDAFIQLRDRLPTGSYRQGKLLENALNAFNGTSDVVLQQCRCARTGAVGLHLERANQADDALAQITDISIFTGMDIDHLSIAGCPNLRDFSVLRSMKLRSLYLDHCIGFRETIILIDIEGLQTAVLTNTGSLSPMRLKMKLLHRLDFSHSHMVKFLRGLKGKSISHLSLDGLERIDDFAPLGEIHIDSSLSLNGTPIDDLAPLRGQPLRRLSLNNCKNLRSLAGLETMPNLQSVSLIGTHVPLEEVQRIKQLLPELDIRYTPPPATAIDVLTFEQVMQIEDRAARLAAFIKLRDSLAPYSKQQAELIRLALNAFNETQGVDVLLRNLDDGTKSLHLRGNGYLYPERPHPTDAITDISVLTGMRFYLLDLTGMKKIEDFSVLQTMQLTRLILTGCRGLTDVGVLNGVKGLERATLGSTNVTRLTDLRPLKIGTLVSLNMNTCLQLRSLDGIEGNTIESLSLDNCRALEDISALSDVRGLKKLSLGSTQVKDLSSIRDLSLEYLSLKSCRKLTSLEGLENMSTLKTLSLRGSGVPQSEDARLQAIYPDLDISRK